MLHRHRTKGVCVRVRVFGGRMARFLEHKTARCYADLGAGVFNFVEVKTQYRGMLRWKKGWVGWML